MWAGLIVALSVVVLDQLSKYWILYEFLGQNSYVPMSEIFNVVRAWNTGVSFSMLNNYGNLGVWILSALAIVIVLFLVGWLKNEKDRLVQIALGFIMGGALGNVIDRLRFGAVFDFLDFHVNDVHWPAFNLADSFICVGAALIIIHAVVEKFVKEKQK